MIGYDQTFEWAVERVNEGIPKMLSHVQVSGQPKMSAFPLPGRGSVASNTASARALRRRLDHVRQCHGRVRGQVESELVPGAALVVRIEDPLDPCDEAGIAACIEAGHQPAVA